MNKIYRTTLAVAAFVLLVVPVTARAQGQTANDLPEHSIRDIFLNYDGINFHGTIWNEGQGKTIVFIPGMVNFWSTGAQFFHREEFSQYTVLAIDPLNHGQSEHGVITDLVDFMNEVILAFMDQEGIDSAFIVGHSVGAIQALSFQHEYPHRAKNKIVVIDLGFFDTLDAPSMDFPEDNLFGIPPGQYDIRSFEMMLYTPEMGMSFEEFVAFYDAYWYYDVASTWPSCKKALLITHDFSIATIPGISEELDAYLAEKSAAFESNVTHATWEEIPGAHYDFNRDPVSAAAVAEAIAAFLPGGTNGRAEP